MGLELPSAEIMTWAEVGQPTDSATQAPLNFYSFLRDRERQGTRRGWGQRKRETQNLKQAPGSELSTELDMGLKPTNREIMI